MENHLPESFKAVRVSEVQRWPLRAERGRVGTGLGICGWVPALVGRQGGPGAGDKAALFRRGRERSPSAACATRGLGPAAAQAFPRSFIIQHALTA